MIELYYAVSKEESDFVLSENGYLKAEEEAENINFIPLALTENGAINFYCMKNLNPGDSADIVVIRTMLDNEEEINFLNTTIHIKNCSELQNSLISGYIYLAYTKDIPASDLFYSETVNAELQ